MRLSLLVWVRVKFRVFGIDLGQAEKVFMISYDKDEPEIFEGLDIDEVSIDYYKESAAIAEHSASFRGFFIRVKVRPTI